jgi:phage gpG-like protein
MVNSGVDTRALEARIRKMKSAASSGGLYDRVKRALAAEALTQVSLGFRESRDPYGEPWAPPIFRKGKPLRDTGRLLNSFTTEVISDGFRIGTKTLYARVHHCGATITAKKGKWLRFPTGRGKARIPICEEGAYPKSQDGADAGPARAYLDKGVPPRRGRGDASRLGTTIKR